ncbi:hypothetical protein L873DRAFT_1684397 [Choiromyces venosus 120613-1]|uniref:F-box domain-containing protein n=1 Tax=Choiromyces venosus 120613-1 TaxID=1336337 RepID=A0A3N4JZR0_9PEZI|nr:hypothetical protein L873DRAFT_1684397 [Choiromyces venosus 120613-1]
MSIVSIESSIDRAKKLVRSKIRSMVDECKIRKFATEIHSESSCHPTRESGYGDVLRMALRTVAFLLPRQRGAAPIQNDTTKSSRSLGDLFFGLPVELQLEVVNKLFFFDLLSLRRASRQFRELTAQNESHIVRHHICHWVPLHITKLYPPPIDEPPALGYLTGLAYKQRVSTHLAFSLARQIVKEMIGGRQSRRMSKEATAYVLNQLRLGMAPLISALYHFFETYRTRRLERLWENNDDDSSMTELDPLSLADKMRLQGDIISQYPDNLLLQVHQMYHLLLHLFMRRMSSPPLSAQRTLGCWTRQRPPNDAFAKVLILGGIKEVWHIYRIKGYCRRRKALDKFIRKLDTERTRTSKRKSGSKAKAATTPQRGKGSSIPLNLDITALSRPDYNHPPPPPLSKLVRLDVDDLTQLWTPAAEHRLLFKGIVGSLEEVRCCGQFVSQLLGGGAESDDEDEEDDADDGDDSDDEDDSGDDEEVSPTTVPGGNTHYSNTLLSADSSWDDEEGESSGLFSDDEGPGPGSVLANV